mmetsp:Transcript_25473/g.85238  ORF Transcript_25473/g.85238 Transcript_25473/m.85238 type:complete len:283 (+) Transcript_25473:759-1607(+)
MRSFKFSACTRPLTLAFWPTRSSPPGSTLRWPGGINLSSFVSSKRTNQTSCSCPGVQHKASARRPFNRSPSPPGSPEMRTTCPARTESCPPALTSSTTARFSARKLFSSLSSLSVNRTTQRLASPFRCTRPIHPLSDFAVLRPPNLTNDPGSKSSTTDGSVPATLVRRDATAMPGGRRTASPTLLKLIVRNLFCCLLLFKRTTQRPPSSSQASISALVPFSVPAFLKPQISTTSPTQRPPPPSRTTLPSPREAPSPPTSPCATALLLAPPTLLKFSTLRLFM